MFTDGQRGTETRLLEFDVCAAFECRRADPTDGASRYGT